MSAGARRDRRKLHHCAVCDQALDTHNVVMYEIAGFTLSQHVSCFARSITHGYRVLNPKSPPVVVTTSPGDDTEVVTFFLYQTQSHAHTQMIQHASLMTWTSKQDDEAGLSYFMKRIPHFLGAECVYLDSPL